MSASFPKSVLLLAAALALGPVAQAQQKPMSTYTTAVDVAITYVAERAKIASVDCGCFWFDGGSGDFALGFYRGLGIAANLTGAHVSNIGSGVTFDKALFAMGPRYTYTPKLHVGNKAGMAVFGEGLFGGVHGFNSVFPTSTGTISHASSFAMQFGGGLDLRFAKHLGIRAVEADYVHSTLPNGAGNVQHDLRLSAGVSFHFSPKP